MYKNEVIELIKETGERLGLTEVETNAVLKKYRGFVIYEEGYDVPKIVSGKIPTCWNTVLGSMYDYPWEVKWTEKMCPECGERLLEIWYTSPRVDWEALAGSAGHMKVCLSCLSHFDFKEEKMS